ncbi:protein of unknown function [Roseomonas rosea]|jgi:Domain of unknown function (DUF4112)|uniref:DUF4112 domain-containing protein n=1 Tax=Muricoccus roseus TaxID=198092 RepID=A0A1M6PGR4_9PROT|nr:DUF4112 domain-containing protein [Roseomonas rosea]SHK07123.1 protein of unknown function [Roseomonas rosea]
MRSGRTPTGFPPGLAAQDERRQRRLETIARLFDSQWRIPGLGIRFGADALLSLVPALGPAVSTAVSAYVIWEARRLGVSPGTLLRMIGNVGLDALISAVPVAGAVGDVFFRANLRNMALLRRHLEQRDAPMPRRQAIAQR